MTQAFSRAQILIQEISCILIFVKVNKIAILLLIACAIFTSFSFVSQTLGNVVGSDTQNFNPITSGIDFVTVHSSETLQPGLINFGFFLNYSRNSLTYSRSVGPYSVRNKPNDSLTSMDLNVGLGLADNWDVGASFPRVLMQSIDSKQSVLNYERTGLTEIRINTKYRWWGNASQGVAVVGSANINYIENNPYTGVGAGPTLNLEIVGDTTFNKTALAANLGYRRRQPGKPLPALPFEPLQDQIIASTAASYLITSVDTKAIVELYLSWPARSVNIDQDRSQSANEILFGLKHDLNSQVSVHLGGSTEIFRATATPDLRIYSGLNWSFGPVWKKKTQLIEFAPPALIPPSESASEPQPDLVATLINDVLFEFDSDQIRPNALDVFEELGRALTTIKFHHLIIEGHTDSIGKESYNLDLSRRRAQHVGKYLISQFGISSQKIKTIGLGESKPIADNGNYQGRIRNRRVEFKIFKSNKKSG